MQMSGGKKSWCWHELCSTHLWTMNSRLNNTISYQLQALKLAGQKYRGSIPEVWVEICSSSSSPSPPLLTWGFVSVLIFILLVSILIFILHLVLLPPQSGIPPPSTPTATSAANQWSFLPNKGKQLALLSNGRSHKALEIERGTTAAGQLNDPVGQWGTWQ